MPRDFLTRVVLRRHRAVSCLAISVMLTAHAAAQPVVLSGLSMSFTKADGTDPSLPVNQDGITSNVALTRGVGGGVYNALAESGFPAMDPGVISPKFTQWATNINNPSETIAATNWDALVFDTWLNAYGGLMAAGPNTVGRDAVLRIIRDELNMEDVYLDIRFTSWSSGGSGGFSYLRSETLNGDYNGNDKIDAADYTVWRDALTAGSTSLLNDSTPGTVDESDFLYWRDHFGETLGSGAGSAAAVPEPSTLSILLMATLAILSRQRGGFINSCIRDTFRERTRCGTTPISRQVVQEFSASRVEDHLN